MSDIFDRKGATARGPLRGIASGVPDGMQSLSELRQEVEAQRRVLLHLVHCQARGEALALHEDPLRLWLGLPLGATPEQAMDRLVRSQAKVLGTSACPSCGARIQEKEGVAPEACPWCGAEPADEE
jgi:hypothetical protein